LGAFLPKGEIMLTSEIERRIVEHLKKNNDEFHPPRVKTIVYSVYGGENVNAKNISSLIREIYGALRKLEKDEVVKNTFHLPGSSLEAMSTSQWLLK
jgi:hypothetical protein